MDSSRTDAKYRLQFVVLKVLSLKETKGSVYGTEDTRETFLQYSKILQRIKRQVISSQRTHNCGCFPRLLSFSKSREGPYPNTRWIHFWSI